LGDRCSEICGHLKAEKWHLTWGNIMRRKQKYYRI